MTDPIDFLERHAAPEVCAAVRLGADVGFIYTSTPALQSRSWLGHSGRSLQPTDGYACAAILPDDDRAVETVRLHPEESSRWRAATPVVWRLSSDGSGPTAFAGGPVHLFMVSPDTATELTKRLDVGTRVLVRAVRGGWTFESRDSHWSAGDLP